MKSLSDVRNARRTNLDLAGRCLAIGLGLAAFCAPHGNADPSPLPDLDVGGACRVLANYAFAATLGQADDTKEFDLCMKRERSMRPAALAAWSASTAKARSECVDLAHGRYTSLTRCLEFSAPRTSPR